MSKALFFNAFPDETSETGYDRNYNADDLSDFLAIVCDTGVVKTDVVNTDPQGLKVVEATGRGVNVKVGKAVIKGKAFINEALEPLTVVANGMTVNRYDYVVVKYDNNISARNITLELRTGTTSIPTASSLVRSGAVYELMLAYIKVAPNTASITQTNITDTRGDAELCPWFTAVKGYDEYYDAIIEKHEYITTLPSIANTVITDLPSKLYNERYTLVDVYTNGIKEDKTAFTVNASSGYVVINFTAQKSAGQKITVILNNFIDGEGMETALAQYTQLLQDVADLKTGSELNYVCNGVNDNILISNLVRTFYSVADYKSLKLNIIGNIGMQNAYGGDGTSVNPYAWFDFTKQVDTNRVATVDFSNCNAITPTIANGTVNYIFRAEEIKILGANVIASNVETDTTVKVFSSSSGRIYAESCRFWLTCYTASVIAHTGTFVNCRGSIANLVSNSYCFLTATTGIVRLYGGEYYAYTGDANVLSAVIGQSGVDAVTIMYGVNAPTNARSGFYQKNSIYQAMGGGMINCTDLVSALDMTVREGASNIRGTIPKSKANLM